MTKRFSLFPLAGLAIAVLAGCGDSQTDGASGDDTTRTASGRFAAGLFQGVQVRSGSLATTIDSDGSFQYEPGTDISFSVGSVQLATVKAEDAENWLLAAHQTELTGNHGVLRVALKDDVTAGYDILVNKLVFLSALDSDEDASNGFSLDSWVDRLTDESIDFNVPYYRFVTTELADFQQRHSLPVGVSAHGLDGLHNALSISLNNYFENTRIVTNEQSRGRTIEYYDFDRNERGQVTREFRQVDNFGDGSINFTETREFSYDSAGLNTFHTISLDKDANGTEDERSQYDYGWTATQKRLFMESRDDKNGDGGFETVSRTDWTYTELDQIETEISRTSRYENGGVTTQTRIMRHTYNEQQQLIETVAEDDETTDGIVDAQTRQTFEYDEQGNQTLQRVLEDTDNDGVVDKVFDVILQFNSDGQLILRRYENDYDGDYVPDYFLEERFVYIDGQLTQEEMLGDRNRDGVVDWQILREYEYDDLGDLRKRIEKYDLDLNGVFESVVSYAFERTRADSGAVNKIVEAKDIGDDGTISRHLITLQAFDDKFGLVTRREEGLDDNLDGVFESSTTTEYAFDDAMNNTTQTTTRVDDDTETTTIERTYEAFPAELDLVVQSKASLRH